MSAHLERCVAAGVDALPAVRGAAQPGHAVRLRGAGWVTMRLAVFGDTILKTLEFSNKPS